MAQDQNNLVWIDLEMTGLVPDSDRIIELAMLVTDAQLNLLAQSPVLVVHQPDSVLAAMDEWNRGMHARSGLTEECATRRSGGRGGGARLSARIRTHKRCRCAATHLHRRFCPLDAEAREYFHYRNLDVSTLKELVRRWKPELMKGLVGRRTRCCRHPRVD